MRRIAATVLVVSALAAPLGCTKAKPTNETFCRELRHTSSLAEVLSGLQSDDPTTIGRKAREAAQQFIKLKRAAPRAIRTEVTQVSDLVTKIAKAVESSPGNPQAAGTILRGEALNVVAATPAALKLIDYSRKTCHYTLGEPNTSAPGTSDVTPTT